MEDENQDELARAPRYTDAAGPIRAFSAADLMYCAKIRGIAGRSRMRKDALLRAVVDYDTRRAAGEAGRQAAAAAATRRPGGAAVPLRPHREGAQHRKDAVAVRRDARAADL